MGRTTTARQEGVWKHRGQELLEFAILLPVLILILFGVLDLGRAFHAAISIENAARVGARYAALNSDASLETIRAVTRNEAQDSGLSLAGTTVNPSFPGGAVSGQPVVVQVIYTFDLVIGFVLPDPQITLVRSAQMQLP